MKKTLLALAFAAAALSPFAAAHAQVALSTSSATPTSLSAGEIGTASLSGTSYLDSTGSADFYFSFLPPTTQATSFLGNYNFSGDVSSVILPVNEAALTASLAGTPGQVTSASFSVTPGTVYELAVTGAANAAFSANVSSAVSAAPEPATWALMMFGLGAVGVAMRRSRSAARTVVAA